MSVTDIVNALIGLALCLAGMVAVWVPMHRYLVEEDEPLYLRIALTAAWPALLPVFLIWWVFDR